jgi:hypothetical protein
MRVTAMPPLPAREVVNAVTHSTREHLRVLTEQNLGVERYHAREICKAADSETFFENSVWTTYSCRLDPHLSLKEDSAAFLYSTECARDTNRSPNRQVRQANRKGRACRQQQRRL